MHPKNRFCSGMKMGNKSYFTYKRAEQEEILKKIEENYCGICGKNMVGWGRREKWFQNVT